MHILIAGGSGFVGSALAERAVSLGHKVTVCTRKPTKLSQHNPQINALGWDSLAGCTTAFDAIINLTGASIADRRWSDSYKQTLRDSRLQTTQQLVEFCKRAEHPPKCFISASAIGFYGSRGDETLTEDSAGGQGFSHQLCSDWEQAVSPLADTSMRVCIARLGVVLGHGGGAFGKMALPFKFKAAVRNGSGEQWFSWIGLEDAVSAMFWLLNNDNASGIYNFTAPQPLTNQQFTEALGKHYNTLIKAPMPAGVIKTLFGEMGEELLLASQRVIPKRLNDEGFEFTAADIPTWLSHLAFEQA